MIICIYCIVFLLSTPWFAKIVNYLVASVFPPFRHHSLHVRSECYVIYLLLWMQFSPVGHYFASSSHDRTARIWSMDRIQPLRIMAGHLSDVDVSYYIQYTLLLFSIYCSFLGSIFVTSSFNFIITY